MRIVHTTRYSVIFSPLVGGFTRALHKPNSDPAPLARSSQMSKGRDLFCTSLFAQVGQEVSFIAGSSYHHDCLSATDSIRQPGPLYTGIESDEYRSKLQLLSLSQW